MAEKEIPVPVQLALEAVEELAKSDTALAEEAKKKLPGFALRMAAAGKEVTVEGLMASARAGEVDRVAAPKQMQKTYAEIVSVFPVQDSEKDSLWNAARTGDIEMFKRLIADELHITQYTINNVLHFGQMDALKFLIKELNIKVSSDYLADAALNGHLEVVKYLVKECGLRKQAKKPRALKEASFGNRLEVMKYLVEEHGAPLYVLTKPERDKLQGYTAACKFWQRTVRFTPSPDFANHTPYYFKAAAYKAVYDILLQEGYAPVSTTAAIAFQASSLFGTEDRVLQYLEKWAEPGNQPLHDLIYGIKLPNDKSPEMDLKAWGDAVLKCGPSMARLVKFANRLPVPEKSDDGRTWSMVKTREKVANFAYKSAKLNPALAALCFEHDVDEDDFLKALKVSQQVPAVKNIPAITIKGEEFDLPGATFRRLAANDIRGLFLGEMTDCCQSIGGAGARCAEHGFTSKDGGFYVVENAKGRVVGQTWAWRGEKDELVFDSLETLGANVQPHQWQKLTEAFVVALSRNPANVTALHIGLGGATKDSLGKTFNNVSPPARPLDYNGYRDSHSQIVIWQKQGELNA